MVTMESLQETAIALFGWYHHWPRTAFSHLLLELWNVSGMKY